MFAGSLSQIALYDKHVTTVQDTDARYNNMEMSDNEITSIFQSKLSNFHVSEKRLEISADDIVAIIRCLLPPYCRPQYEPVAIPRRHRNVHAAYFTLHFYAIPYCSFPVTFLVVAEDLINISYAKETIAEIVNYYGFDS